MLFNIILFIIYSGRGIAKPVLLKTNFCFLQSVIISSNGMSTGFYVYLYVLLIIKKYLFIYFYIISFIFQYLLFGWFCNLISICFATCLNTILNFQTNLGFQLLILSTSQQKQMLTPNRKNINYHRCCVYK